MSKSFLQLFFLFLFSFLLYFFIPQKVLAQEITITVPSSAGYNQPIIDVTINSYGNCSSSNPCSVVLFDGDNHEIQRQPCDTPSGICFMVNPYFNAPGSGPPTATIKVFDRNNQLLPGGQKTITLTGTPPPTPNPAAGCTWPDNGNCSIGSAPYPCIVNSKVLWCCPNEAACNAQATQVPQPSPRICKPGDEDCTSAGGQSCSDDPNNPGFVTAIGCIHTNPAEFIKDLMKFIVGISGGLAFLMMLLGAFQMLTSAGNPETLNAGRERLTNAVIGLLFVIFAILLLQIIGVDILKIPGFGR